MDADPAACDREEDLDELIETVDTTEMEIKDEEVKPVRWSRRLVFMERFSQMKHLYKMNYPWILEVYTANLIHFIYEYCGAYYMSIFGQ